MKEQVVRRVSFVVLENESTDAGVPAGYEPIALSGERFQPAEFIEDELIVSLPLIPRHARVEQCGALARRLQAHGAAARDPCIPLSQATEEN